MTFRLKSRRFWMRASSKMEGIVKRKLTLEELVECREAFDMFDKDNDGIITTKDVKPAMRALVQIPNSVVLEKILEKEVKMKVIVEMK